MTALLALLLAAARAPLPFAPVEARAEPPRGAVVEVVRGVAYLDAGAGAGLAPGQVLALHRGGAPAGSCRVLAVAPRSASCAGAGLREGDTFQLAAPSPGPAPPPPIAAPHGAEETARRRAALEAAPVERLAAKPLPARAPWRGAEARAGVASYLAGDPRHQGWFGARLRGAPLARGLALDLDVTGVLRARGADGARFREGERWLVEVREAAVRGDPAGRLALSAGRFLPWRAGGARRIDGVQVGLRMGALEAGIFGGALPEPGSTAPTAERATAGVYLAHARAGARVTAREEARLAWTRTPELESRLEAEGRSVLAFGRAVDLVASARLGVGAAQAPGLLDEARLDLAARAGARLTFTGGVRYAGLVPPAGADLPAPAILPGPTRRAEGGVRWDARPWLALRLSGGGVADPESDLSRTFLGPDVSFWLFSRRLGVSLGYLEERGWLAGRSLALGVTGVPAAWIRLGLRGLASMRTRVDPLPAAIDLGGGLSADAELGRGVALRGAVQVLVSASRQGAPEGRGTLELVVAR